MKFLPLSQGKSAIIDDTDFEKMGQFKWYAQKTPTGDFYAVRNVGRSPNQKKILLHGALLGVVGVDHKNGNGLDCRRENMRPATKQQNGRAFRRKITGTTSSFRGVYWHKYNSAWCAQIITNKTKFYLGYFSTPEDAARAYDKKAMELGFFPEALNFPN